MCPDGNAIRNAQAADRKTPRRASTIHALLVWVGATAAAAQVPVPVDCPALKQASAQAQSSYNRAQLRLSMADRQYRQTTKAGESVQARLAANAARLEKARQDATDAAQALADCREQNSAKGCATAAAEASAAERRLAEAGQQESQLQSDAAALQTRSEKSSDELASAQREVNSQQIALSAAVVAAAGCTQSH